ncbi:MAG: universal stress protein [Anaerolineae bacterium]|nr:universal stress protein [Anaerolineae bacterium]
MFKKILVPLDGSELAERSLEPALALAQQTNGEILLLSVPVLQHMFNIEPAGYGFMLPEQSVDQSRRELQQYLHGVQERCAHPNVTVRTMLAEGDEAAVIVEMAAEQEIDLIVMSTHGRTGFTRWMLGSVTEKVLREAPCPVLVIRNNQPVTRLIITLDGSALAEQAIPPGLELAAGLGCQVTLFRVVPPLDVDPHLISTLDKMENGFGDRLREDGYNRASDYLKHLAIAYSDEYPDIATEVWGGDPARTIIDFVEARHINLIVMATHGYAGFQRWVHGSVTEKVLRTAPCAMLVVRPQPEG